MVKKTKKLNKQGRLKLYLADAKLVLDLAIQAAKRRRTGLKVSFVAMRRWPDVLEKCLGLFKELHGDILLDLSEEEEEQADLVDQMFNTERKVTSNVLLEAPIHPRDVLTSILGEKKKADKLPLGEIVGRMDRATDEIARLQDAEREVQRFEKEYMKEYLKLEDGSAFTFPEFGAMKLNCDTFELVPSIVDFMSVQSK